MTGNRTYDYIIAGSGAAGLSLAVHMIRSGIAENKKILLADRAVKNENDRTWCFWEKENGPFEDIVYKRWVELVVYPGDAAKRSSIAPYTYKMIRGIDFYRYCLRIISEHPSVTQVTGEITAIVSSNDHAAITVNGIEYTAQYIFSSILLQPPQIGTKQHYLLQHFKGWLIETGAGCFDPDAAVFMDFRVPQQQDARFVYVLPFSKTQALVEYTVFSHEVLADDEYDRELKSYTEKYITQGKYTIQSIEKGVIPMTDYRFPRRDGHIFYIGTSGGNTRGSSGFTFRNIQKHSAAIVEQLQHGRAPEVKDIIGRRASFYDAVLLGVLGNHYCDGKKVFTRLFQKRKLPDVLSFLDGESSFFTELKMIAAEPAWPFIKSAWKYMMR